MDSKLTLDPAGVDDAEVRIVPGENIRFSALMGRREWLDLLHPKGSRGLVFLSRTLFHEDPAREPEWVDEGLRVGEIGQEELFRARFLTLSRYWRPDTGERITGRRKTEAAIRSLRATWVDLDFHGKPKWARFSPQEMVLHVLFRLSEERLPRPSLIMCSGRGLLILWLHEETHRRALPIWKALQKRLNDAFVDMGRDASSLTPTRVFRIPGTKNRGLPVSVIWPIYRHEIAEWSFNDLCAEALPWSREDVRDYKARKAAKRAERRGRLENGGTKLTGRSFWSTMAEDLERLYRHRHGDGPVPKGARDMWLFMLTAVAAWRMSPEDLVAYADEQAERIGLSQKRGRSYVTSTIRRARDAAAGKKRLYAKTRKQVDPRYSMSWAKASENLDITAHDAREADLRLLAPKAVKMARAAERMAKHRAKLGAKPRADLQAERLEAGRQALAMRAEGLKRPEIAVRLNKSPRWVDKAISEAKAVAMIGTGKAAAKSSKVQRTVRAGI